MFFESSGAGNVLADVETERFLAVNDSFCALTGYSREELLRLSGRELTHPDDKERDARGWREALRTGNRHHTIEKRYVRKNGAELWVSVTSGLLRDAAGEPLYLTGMVTDVTEKKFLKQALLDAGEREQRRIGQELHEGVCQQLIGAAFGAQALSRELEKSASPSAERAEELARIINDALLHARDLARGINPVELDSAGLMSALQELAERTRAVAARIELRCDRPVLVRNAETARHVFRIAQDALANALGCAGVTRVLILLEKSRGSVILQIRDDGRLAGVPPSTDAGVRVGIMKYRSQAIHGDLSIEAAADGGNVVTCIFPNP